MKKKNADPLQKSQEKTKLKTNKSRKKRRGLRGRKQSREKAREKNIKNNGIGNEETMTEGNEWRKKMRRRKQ